LSEPARELISQPTHARNSNRPLCWHRPRPVGGMLAGHRP
jgi:hypothetical protein